MNIFFLLPDNKGALYPIVNQIVHSKIHNLLELKDNMISSFFLHASHYHE